MPKGHKITRKLKAILSADVKGYSLLMADAGGICISRNTFNQIEAKLDIQTKYLGEHQVKNIKNPVRVYEVLLDSDEYKPLVEEKLELPDKPSIAVLPFNKMSGDPSQEYFSDGLTEQIINGLCKVSNLFVIARNSSFAYKGKSVGVKQIAKELGVKYILEGSVQKVGNRVKITAQLIDTTTDYHMWSETYDRNLEDIFALQDEITMNVITEMQVKLIHGEQAKRWTEGTNSLDAYMHTLKGYDYPLGRAPFLASCNCPALLLPAENVFGRCFPVAVSQKTKP
jgi:adenylate cyclase